MSDITQQPFIVAVRLREYDSKQGFEKGDITTVHVPVVAQNKDEAEQKVVVWQSDNGTASRNNDHQWSCTEPERGLSWTAIRSLPVSQDEFDIFLCITQGLRDALICGDNSKK
jgi:hypothetical protein